VIGRPINKDKAPFGAVIALEERGANEKFPFFPFTNFKAIIPKAQKHAA
jgi:hypothetical protein